MDYVHPENGAIEQLADGTWKVYVWAKQKSMQGLPGVQQEPRIDQKDVPEDKELFSKHFKKKHILLESEKEKASPILLSNYPNVIRLGATGYSSLNEKELRKFGIPMGTYERICEDVIGRCIEAIYEEYPDIVIVLMTGASNMGIDLALMNVGNEFNMNQVDFSCPRFLMYVKDDDRWVIVCKDQPAYSALYTSLTQILLACAGRKQALKFDITGSTEKGGKLFLADVMSLLTGNMSLPPSFDEEGLIQDATGAFYDSVEAYGDDEDRPRPKKYKRFLNWLLPQVVDHCRKLTPSIAYDGWRRNLKPEMKDRTARLLKETKNS